MDENQVVTNNEVAENVQVDNAPVNPAEPQNQETVVNSTENEQTETNQPETNPQPQFYKSQQEINKALSKRMSTFEKKWNTDHQDVMTLANTVQAMYPGIELKDIIKDIEERQINQMSEEMGITPEAARYMYNTNKNARAGSQQQQQTSNEEDDGEISDDQVDDLLNQEDQIKKEIPNFDLANMISTNPTFKTFIVNGIPVKQALLAINPDAFKKQIENQVVENIKNRNMTTTVMTKPTGQGAQIDVSKLTEAQIKDISARAQRGERITF